MKETFKVEHRSGDIEVNIAEFFTTQTAKAKKLFAVAQNNCNEIRRIELLDSLTHLAECLQKEVIDVDVALNDPELNQGGFNVQIRRYQDCTKKRACLAKNIFALRNMKWLAI